MLQAIATGQVQTSGLAVHAQGASIRRRLSSASSSTMPGSPNACRPAAPATAAIFTDHVKVAHIIRKVLLRQIAIMNYVNPF